MKKVYSKPEFDFFILSLVDDFLSLSTELEGDIIDPDEGGILW